MEKAGLAVDDDLRDAPDARGHHRNPAAQRFQRGQTEALDLAGEKEDVAVLEDLQKIQLLAHERHGAGEIELLNETLDSRPLRAVSDEHEQRGDRPVDLGEDVNHILDPLEWTEVRIVDQHARSKVTLRPPLPVSEQPLNGLLALVRHRFELLRIDEIRDDLDRHRARYVE